MKIRFVLLYTLSLATQTIALYGQFNGTPSAVISGDSCINSLLTLTENVPAQSIVWKLNGTTVVGTQNVVTQSIPTVVAGGNGAGAASNQLYAPDRLYVDANGNMYIPDLGNNRVQKWAPGAASGVTVAGGNGAGGAANQFNRPTAVFVDQQGNIYVADQTNERIQKWLPGATTGITLENNLNGLSIPTGLFVDAQGFIYVSEQGYDYVIKYPPGGGAGVIVAGGAGYGNSPSQLGSPTGVFVDAQGNVYVCDSDNNRVQKWAPGAVAGITVAGGNGFGSNANQLANPLGLCVDCSGNLYIADFNNNRVQKWAPGAVSGTTIAGGGGLGSGPSQLNNPASVFLDLDNSIYISDYGNNRVLKLANNIVKTFTATSPGSYTATVTSLCGSVTSNALTIVASKTPVIQISADSRFACPGMPVTFTATISYGGLQPVYQWKKNNIDVGANASTYIDNTIADGDVITCSLVSNDRCLLSSNATANVITMSKVSPPDLGRDVTICPGTQATFNAHSGYAGYTWQDGSTDSVFTATEPGVYYVKVADLCQDQFSDTVSVFFYDVNTHFLPADTSMCSFDQLELRPSALFSQYTWSNGASGPAITVDAPGLYWLQVVDANSCSSRDSVLVRLKDACPAQGVYVPGAFTPNTDGKNDVFRPLVYGSIKSYQFSVYNRYGQLVFTTKEPGRGWDGKVKGNLPDANVFVWYCAYQFNGGTLHTEKGTVMLIR